MAPACGAAAWVVARFIVPAIERAEHTEPAATVVHRVAAAVGTGMTAAILVAATLGIVLPFLFRAVKVDPAIASGPIVTTVNDIMSVTIFLSLAAWIMTV